jgi:nicotinamide-nucleotide amidase
MEKIKRMTENIIRELTHREETITFAESCTGGRIAAAFTAVSGASSVLNGACITYSNEIKHRWLGVEKEVLENHGAVSKECVSQMLDGIMEMAQADYAIAVSGIAGPTGGTEFKPVGTVYIGITTPETKEIHHCLFQGDRESVQEQSVSFAIQRLAKLLKIKNF